LSYEIPEMDNILNIEGEPIFDDRIVKIETYVQFVRQHDVWTSRWDKNIYT